jgi:predicted PurR-regulated permease PerM
MVARKNNQKKAQVIQIDTTTILKFVAILIGLYIVWRILDILATIFIAFIIASALNPLVNNLEGKKVPRLLGTIIVYFLLLLIVALIILIVAPPIAFQVKAFYDALPTLIDRLNPAYDFISRQSNETGFDQVIRTSLSKFAEQFGAVASGAFKTTRGIVYGFTAILTIFVISFYSVLGGRKIKEGLLDLLPTAKRKYWQEIFTEIVAKLGAWTRGQVVLSLTVGIIISFVLWILGVPYALALGLIAAVFEIIPVIGPIIAAIPAVILALTISPWLALGVIIVYIVVQQLENHILVPKIMGSAVGISPLLAIIVVLIGAKLAGVLGIIVSIPLTASIGVILKKIR